MWYKSYHYKLILHHYMYLCIYYLPIYSHIICNHVCTNHWYLLIFTDISVSEKITVFLWYLLILKNHWYLLIYQWFPLIFPTYLVKNPVKTSDFYWFQKSVTGFYWFFTVFFSGKQKFISFSFFKKISKKLVHWFFESNK